mmetsp:Transcript_117962/g.306270  ORF Transcript_117962/g.306270 Transcript_117962/m.306270 type:complete len:343 (-) Transcript_117962:127-1155(-)
MDRKALRSIPRAHHHLRAALQVQAPAPPAQRPRSRTAAAARCPGLQSLRTRGLTCTTPDTAASTRTCASFGISGPASPPACPGAARRRPRGRSTAAAAAAAACRRGAAPARGPRRRVATREVSSSRRGGWQSARNPHPHLRAARAKARVAARTAGPPSPLLPRPPPQRHSPPTRRQRAGAARSPSRSATSRWTTGCRSGSRELRPPLLAHRRLRLRHQVKTIGAATMPAASTIARTTGARRVTGGAAARSVAARAKEPVVAETRARARGKVASGGRAVEESYVQTVLSADTSLCGCSHSLPCRRSLAAGQALEQSYVQIILSTDSSLRGVLGRCAKAPDSCM